ncbi:thiamine biosynthesis protein MoeB [Bacillus lacus]|uniref:Thiamine biosynthesis protein MoeB n=1 Tax=Metabacillus lacus TaxID=1983721 RepID=A0A7X2J1G0_9BACI|nr:thiazole biosynthesis adenylyltransferase ThiF [Metabacillus lacus]MRX73713.1 thiamine biosynthesis protein MoeB [Metabacillus lacus]
MERYSRQVLFSPIGEEGQVALASKHAVIAGAGALGTGSAEMLARAGVGKLTVIDRDYVEWSNLQRQQLYTELDARDRLPKAAAAEKRLREINSEIEVYGLIEDITALNAENLIGGADVLIDATDNFDTRFILNDVSQKLGIPWIYGGCVGSYGMSYSILPEKSPCLHCLLKQLPMEGYTCDTVGIISPAVGMTTAYQTAEALKILSGNTDQLRSKLVSFDLWHNQHTSINIDKLKDPACTSCGENRVYPYLNYENATKTAVLCGRDSVQIRPGSKRDIDFAKLAEAIAESGGEASANPYLLSVAIDGFRMVVFKDGRALIHGTKDVSAAKNLYYRYLG